MKIPKNEKIVLAYIFENIKRYAVTRNTMGRYILYKVIDNNYQKMKTAETPLEFDEIVEKDRRN